MHNSKEWCEIGEWTGWLLTNPNKEVVGFTGLYSDRLATVGRRAHRTKIPLKGCQVRLHVSDCLTDWQLVKFARNMVTEISSALVSFQII